MSGTSADGIDAVLAEIDGSPPALTWQVLSHVAKPYPVALRDEIFACFRPETGSVDRLCALNFVLGHAFADTALACATEAGLGPEQIDLIGSHGQTIWHVPSGPQASTLQLGDAAVIAERTGITTVNNFRTRDIAAGGQGAPLVAYVDTLLFTHDTLTRSCLNIGGIANFTYVPKRGAPEAPFAFDTGPGNMLIDDAVLRITNGAQHYDAGGGLAAQGIVSDVLFEELMDHPYVATAPPKTTGREVFGRQFGAAVWERGRVLGLSDADLLATLTMFTAASIAFSHRRFCPRFPDEVIVSGGGARNATLLKFLREHLRPARVLLSDDIGLAAEAKEAMAFAVLAHETVHGRPSNLPAATGARHPVVLGSITPGAPAAFKGRTS
jgi:anhydro-N-acetylmuramic acid kinase